MAAHPTNHPVGARTLALALVASSSAPVLLLDGDLTVIAASTSFLQAFGDGADSIDGRKLSEVGRGEWDTPRLRSLLKATAGGQASIDAYEMDLEIAPNVTRRLVLNATNLDHVQAEGVRLLLTISDVTDARLAEKQKDDLIREKAVLLQELQHRVANSLQIIASVILQSARNVQSEETRLHLTDAHNRVMSVAALQQQLSANRLGEVRLRAYFTQLCESIGASMVHDRRQLSIQVDTDDSAVVADVSVSLGLIVTELVINALKHAFPGGRPGKILVRYRSNGTDWKLSIADDGVGMPPDTIAAKPGLGTSIVEALASQLSARITVTDQHPGVKVAISHDADSEGKLAAA